MRKLFKNSFFSFLKNKTIVILLSLIIFLTTATFTAFNSAATSFENSYNDVVSQGRLHDFVIKEKYGSEFFEPHDTKEEHKFSNAVFANKKSPNYFNFGKDGEYIAFSGNAWGKEEEGVFVVKSEDADKFLKGNNTLDIDMLYKQDDKNAFVRISEKQLEQNEGNINSVIQNVALGEKIDVKGILNKHFELSYGNVEFLKNSNDELKVATTPEWIDKFRKNLKPIMDSAYSVANGKYSKYVISLNKIKSLQAYENSKKENKNLAENEFYVLQSDLKNPKYFTIDKQGDKVIDWNKISCFDTSDFTPFNVADHVTSLSESDVESSMQHKKTIGYLDNFQDKKELEYKDVESLYITGQNTSFKFVNNKDSSSNVDKLKIFSGWGIDKEESWDEKVKKLDQMIIDNYPKLGYPDNVKGIKDSDVSDGGFRALWRHDYIVWGKNSIPLDLAYTDVSSYSAVVSPSYAKANGKTPLSKDLWLELKSKINDILSDSKKMDDSAANTSQDIKNLLSNYTDNVIWVENTPYVVTGIGISPDFSYPIVDASSPIPDPNTQAIVYTNNAGHARIKEAFAGNPTENYIAVKTTKAAPSNLFKTVNEYLTDKMSWPPNMQAARMVNDLDEKYLLAPQRITFLQKIRTTVSTISWTTTSLLILFTAFIVGLVIRKQINNRRKQLAILMANGYTKFEISVSMIAIGLIVASASTIAGYLTGHFMQTAFVKIFESYWTLPITQIHFSWIAFVTTVVIPIIGISGLAFVISYIELRGNLVDMLNGNASQNGTFIARVISAPFKAFGIKTKLTVSIFASNLSKMMMALAAFAAAITVSTIALNSFGKFDTALTQSSKLTDYEYQVDLVNPTAESGAYQRLSLEDMVDPKTLLSNDKGQVMYEHSGANGMPTDETKPYYHVPTKTDEYGQYNEPKYLKNRLQMKSLLGPKMGVMGKGASPWVIARKMMPENQKNVAEQKYIQFRNWSLEHFRKLKVNIYKDKTWWPKDGSNNIILDGGGILKNILFDPHIDPSYIDFVEQSLKAAAEEYKTNRNVPIPYAISYGNVIMDEDDETYTHIDTTVTYKNFKSKKVTEDWEIRGIDENSERINLSKSSLTALKRFKEPNVTPVVVNKYFAKVHGVKVGDKISSLVTNMSQAKQFTPDQREKQYKNFKIVGIENSYDSGRTFTLQKYANHLLGWDLDSWDDKNHMFNGVYSTHKDELMFKTLSLYSQSGFYEAINKLNPMNLKNEVTKTMQKSVWNWANANGNKQVIGKDALETLTRFTQTYGSVPYVLAYSNVDWDSASNYQFHSVMTLSSSLIWLIEGIAFFIAVLFVALISTMIISDNKKFISTLKVLGYRTREISNIFLRTFVPSLIISVILAGILASSIVLGIQAILIGFGNVLIPFNIASWEILAATGVLIIGFLITYYASSKELKNTSLLNAFK